VIERVIRRSLRVARQPERTHGQAQHVHASHRSDRFGGASVNAMLDMRLHSWVKVSMRPDGPLVVLPDGAEARSDSRGELVARRVPRERAPSGVRSPEREAGPLLTKRFDADRRQRGLEAQRLSAHLRRLLPRDCPGATYSEEKRLFIRGR
jgi:hypothetical protein